MKKIVIVILMLGFIFNVNVYAQEEPEQLYAQSAVLMDADSGRVLFEKNGTDVKAMASTTKIMTCILALEYGEEDKIVTFSKEAQKQPQVHLGAKEGEQFYLKDLLLSLMLESHNDSAVAIAESIAGDVKIFADLMNQKAEKIGCKNTYFITPNGLDASDEKGMHSTTAVDLARIMSYCIMASPKKERFIEITTISQHSFQNIERNKSYSCNNHNSFLNMMDEAISGKTGFTSKAGYCYVGAVESEGRTFIVSLLACGWPNNKNYKWEDMKRLIKYGMDNYEFQTLNTEIKLKNIHVHDGIPKTKKLFDDAYVSTRIETNDEYRILMRPDEKIEVEIKQKKQLLAPIKCDEKVGYVIYKLNGKPIVRESILSNDTVEKKDFAWCFCKIVDLYAL